MALVALAGPLSNIIMGFVFAICFGLIYKSAPQTSSTVAEPLLYMLNTGILINFFLAFFNLIPIPPLDGSRIISLFLSYRHVVYIDMLAPYGFIIILLLWQVGILGILVGFPARILYSIAMGLV
jgi:Zn-dependent protease